MLFLKPISANLRLLGALKVEGFTLEVQVMSPSERWKDSPLARRGKGGRANWQFFHCCI